MTFDDFLFYLPGYASVPLILAGAAAVWLALRLFHAKKTPPKTEKTEPPDIAKSP